MATKRKRSSRKRPRTSVEKVDLAAARQAAEWRAHPLVRGLGWLSELADQPQLYTICAVTALVGVGRGHARLARTGVRMLAAEWLATKAKSALKHRINRTRPEVTVDRGHYSMERGSSHETELNSFPSGHTAGAVAVARAFSSEYPEHALKAAALAGLIGLIQIPRCKHFASDIGVGAVLGLAAGSLVSRSSTREATISSL